MDFPLGDWIRELYPDETDPTRQERLDEAMGWVALYAPCVNSASFPEEKQAIVRSLVKRAMRYEKMSNEGTVATRGTGPFNVTYDTRRPSSSTLFNKDQIAVLKSLCDLGFADPGAVSIPLER